MSTNIPHILKNEGNDAKSPSIRCAGPASTPKTAVYHINLLEMPPDDSLLDFYDINQLLELDIVPWRKFGTRMIYVSGNVSGEWKLRPSDGITHTNYLPADTEHIREYIKNFLTDENLKEARKRCPEIYSCRNFSIRPTNYKFIIGLAFISTTLLAFPAIWLLILFIWLMVANLSTTLLRLSALLLWRRDNDLPYWLPEVSTRISEHRKTPKVSILVPLFRENAVLPRLIETLELLEYPHDSLEVLFLLEEVDTQTAASLSKIAMPEFIHCVTIPKDWLQTKPKAMNYALPHCTGDIVGIYDAEDRPDPDQILKVVDHFWQPPPTSPVFKAILISITAAAIGYPAVLRSSTRHGFA